VVRPEPVRGDEAHDECGRYKDEQMDAAAVAALTALNEFLLGDLEGHGDVASGGALIVHIAHATEQEGS